MSPKSKEQFEEIRQRSMEKIKNVALELFAHKGFHSTSISQIHKAAGVSKGLLYNYFDGKEDLLRAIIQDAIDLGERMIGEIIHETDDPHEQLEKLTEVSFRVVVENLHYWKLLTSLVFQPDAMEGMNVELKKTQKQSITFFISLFEQMGYANPKMEAFIYGAMMDGVMIQYFQMGEEYPLAEMKDAIIKKYRKK